MQIKDKNNYKSYSFQLGMRVYSLQLGTPIALPPTPNPPPLKIGEIYHIIINRFDQSSDEKVKMEIPVSFFCFAQVSYLGVATIKPSGFTVISIRERKLLFFHNL